MSHKYWIELGGHQFSTIPLSNGGFVLSVDEQFTSFNPRAEDVAESCLFGHVTTVASAERPYLVRTRGLKFPKDLSGWNAVETAPLEVFE